MTPSATPLSSEAEHRTSVDTLLQQANRELLIFDRDLTALKLEEPQRIELLRGFLDRGPHCRIRIIIHDPIPAQTRSPRFMNLLSRHAHAIHCKQASDEFRHLADSHVIADEQHAVRRFQFGQSRGVLILEDPIYVKPWLKRFEELWALCMPTLATDTTGL